MKKISSSICPPLTTDTIKADVVEIFFQEIQDSLHIIGEEFEEGEAFINNMQIEKYLNEKNESNQKSKIKIYKLDDNKILNINIWQSTFDIIEIFQQFQNDEIENTENAKSQINAKIKNIKDTLEKFEKKYSALFKNNKLGDIEIDTTHCLFANGEKEISKLLENIKNTEKQASKMQQNEINKQIVSLMVFGFYYSHTSIVAVAAETFLNSRMLVIIARALFGLNPVGATLFLVVLTFQALWYFYKQKDKDELKVKIYEFYCVLNEISKSLMEQNSPLASVVNLYKNYSGNAILFKEKDNYFLRFLTTPFSNGLDKAIVYKMTIQDSLSLSSLLDKNNTKMDKCLQSSKQFAFSTYPIIQDTPKDEDIMQTSAFNHLKSISLQFSNFLFIQTPYFTSTLTLDFLLQSCKISSQNNNAISNKMILCVSNIVDSDNVHYQIQNHIRDTLIQKASTQGKSILFLNLIEAKNKERFFRDFKTDLLSNFSLLEQQYYDGQHFVSRVEDLKSKLENLYENYGSMSLAEIANHFYEINEFIFSICKSYFEKIHPQTTKIFNILFEFDTILSNFLDFKIKRDKNKQIDENDLKVLRDKIREQIANITNLSPSIFAISHLLNNALFSLNPSKELKTFKELLENSVKEKEFQDYKNCLKEELKLNHIDFREIARDIIPFKETSLWLSFFSYEHQDDMCVFLIYLLDKDLNGNFLRTLKDLKYCKEIIDESNDESEIKKIDLREAIKQNLAEKIEDNLEKSIIDEISQLMAEKLGANYFKFALAVSHKALSKDIKEKIEDIKKILREDKNLESNQLVEKIKILKDAKNGNLNDAITISITDFDFYKHIFNNYGISFKNTIVERLYNLAKKSSLGLLKGIVPFLIMNYIDNKFPTIENEDLKRIIAMLALGMRPKSDKSYAKWGKEVFFIPKELHKTLLIADFQASLLLDTALDIGYCIHNPSIAAYTHNPDLAKRQFKFLIQENLKPYIVNYFLQYQESESTKIYERAYYKINAYMEQLKDETYHIETLTTNTIIKDKLKGQNGIKASQDFLIQLKRVAEYNYGVYKGDTGLEKKEQNDDEPIQETILNNFIYNENFIPTKIDV